MDWRYMAEMMAAGEAVYDELKNLIVWVKDNGGMGTFYRSRHQLVSPSRKVSRRTSTPLSSASMAVTGPMSGPIGE
jgi:hypothetical protein